jgi:hypothetical protein
MPRVPGSRFRPAPRLPRVGDPARRGVQGAALVRGSAGGLGDDLIGVPIGDGVE